MPARLGANSYGKSRVRLLKVSRAGPAHTIRELAVDIALAGDFTAAHTSGDNTLILPTDTMKNTVYALAKDHPLTSIESFAAHLADHFTASHRPCSAATVHIAESPWDRAAPAGSPHPHCFLRGPAERALCEVTRSRGQPPAVRSGLSDLVILKSADSAFSNFTRDKYTTLQDTEDRIFCTSVTAWWGYLKAIDHAAARRSVRDALIATFAAHKSRSVQETLYAMGEAALATCPAIDRIHLSLPNKHCILANLSPFGLDNSNEIFIPTDEPHGLIEATIERT